MGNLESSTDAKILIVDDEPAVRSALKRILKPVRYELAEACDGKEALQQVDHCMPDLILLDMMMPGMNGIEVTEKLKRNAHTQHIAIIVLTASATPDIHIKALTIGADDFISKTANPAEIVARVKFHALRKHKADEIRREHHQLAQSEQTKTNQLNFVSKRLKDASLEVIWRLTAASEYRDNETGAHIKRMSHYSAAVAKQMGLNQRSVDRIVYAAPMHDIGKIGIPDKILLKPGRLNAFEWKMMQLHPVIGADILKNSTIGFVRLAAVIAMTHHEKWDGSGYPKGLKGRQIPLVGRITALADVFDALTSKRPYKEAFPVEQSLEIMEKGRGSHFDPDVLDAFFCIQDQIIEIKTHFIDEKENPLVCLEHFSSDPRDDLTACL